MTLDSKEVSPFATVSKQPIAVLSFCFFFFFIYFDLSRNFRLAQHCADSKMELVFKYTDILFFVEFLRSLQPILSSHNKNLNPFKQIGGYILSEHSDNTCHKIGQSIMCVCVCV